MIERRAWTGYVVVSGPPASGKSTLARSLARELGLPLLSKDTIKHGIMAVLPATDIEMSRQIGRAAAAALLAVAQEVGYAVLEAPWYRARAAPALKAFPAPVIEVFCRCDPATAADRFHERIGTRGPGHFDDERTAGELWNDDVAQPLAAGWPVIEVDTNGPVDIGSLVTEIRQLQRS